LNFLDSSLLGLSGLLGLPGLIRLPGLLGLLGLLGFLVNVIKRVAIYSIMQLFVIEEAIIV